VGNRQPQPRGPDPVCGRTRQHVRDHNPRIWEMTC
jgi:hypothetical protein